MSSFTHMQDIALKQLLTKIVEKGQDQELVSLIKENDLLSAVDRDSHHDSIRADIDMVAENEGVELTEAQREAILQKILSDYDYADYNEYIGHLISDIA